MEGNPTRLVDESRDAGLNLGNGNFSIARGEKGETRSKETWMIAKRVTEQPWLNREIEERNHEAEPRYWLTR